MKTNTLCLVLFQLASFAYGATYQVPVPTELSDHNQWNITGHAVARVNGDTLEVKYQLPSDLVGDHHGQYQFTGKTGSSFVAVKGEGVHGTCMVANAKPLACMLKYPRLDVVDAQVDASLAKNFSGGELDLRKRVARIFSADPAGILSVEVTTGDQSSPW